MKKSLSFFIVMFVLLWGLSLSPAYALRIADLQVLDDSIIIGETFKVAIYADGHENSDQPLDDPIQSFGFEVDPLDSLSVAIWDPLSIVLGTGFFNVSGNQNDVGGLYMPNFAPEETILLATLSFTATALGEDVLNIEGLADSSFQGIRYSIDNGSGGFIRDDLVGSVKLNVSPVPEPSTIMLLCSGIIGLAGLRRNIFKR